MRVMARSRTLAAAYSRQQGVNFQVSFRAHPILVHGDIGEHQRRRVPGLKLFGSSRVEITGFSAATEGPEKKSVEIHKYRVIAAGVAQCVGLFQQIFFERKNKLIRVGEAGHFSEEIREIFFVVGAWRAVLVMGFLPRLLFPLGLFFCANFVIVIPSGSSGGSDQLAPSRS